MLGSISSPSDLPDDADSMAPHANLMYYLFHKIQVWRACPSSSSPSPLGISRLRSSHPLSTRSTMTLAYSAMNCPALDGYFSNTVCNQFNLFSLLIKKLAGGPHGDVVHRVMMWLVRNHFGWTSGWLLCGSDAATTLGAGTTIQVSN